MAEKRKLIDLRSFGAIGFQDAPNGLWLGKQNYLPQSKLLERIIDSCIDKGVDVTAITTEDDCVIPGYPEDRFGFLANQIKSLKGPYDGEKIDNTLMMLRRDQDRVYLVNSETVHANKMDNWGGLKVQVIGRNMIPKYNSLSELLNYCKFNGFPTLLCNVGQNQKTLTVAEIYLDTASAIITHDANNTFPAIINHLPFFNKYFGKYSVSSNKRARDLVEKTGVNKYLAEVAVSSSHFLHQMGRAGIIVDTVPLELSSGRNFLYSLNAVLSSRIFDNKEDYNSIADVLKFGYLLSRYGSAPDRFRGSQSSYNKMH